jgi:hypothetical protein
VKGRRQEGRKEGRKDGKAEERKKEIEGSKWTMDARNGRREKEGRIPCGSGSFPGKRRPCLH